MIKGLWITLVDLETSHIFLEIFSLTLDKPGVPTLLLLRMERGGEEQGTEGVHRLDLSAQNSFITIAQV